MRRHNRQVVNQEARERAQHQRVYISGLEGDHSLETGLAYYYRGHFIYTYPAGNPIEPIPYSTRRGISIVGIAGEQAPPYDSEAGGLVQEESIAALQLACVNELRRQSEQEEDQIEETPQGLDQTNRDGLSQPSPPTPHRHISTSQNSSPLIRYTPHDRAHFLAYSAPGSLHPSATNSPQPSRAESPIPVTSSATPNNSNPSPETSTSTPSDTDTLLPGLGHIEQSAQRQEIWRVSSFPADTLELLHQEEMQILSNLSRRRTSLGRPHEASMALNESYNAANPPCPEVVCQGCPIYGETCDGVTTTEQHETERARLGAGFEEDYPMVKGEDGREMVDWKALVEGQRGV